MTTATRIEAENRPANLDTTQPQQCYNTPHEERVAAWLNKHEEDGASSAELDIQVEVARLSFIPLGKSAC